MTRRRFRSDEHQRPADRPPEFIPGRRFAFASAGVLVEGLIRLWFRSA